MTLILKLDLDMIKMYLHTENELSMLRGSKVIAWTDRNTDRQTDTDRNRQTDRQTDMTENITYPHTRMVKIFPFVTKAEVGKIDKLEKETDGSNIYESD